MIAQARKPATSESRTNSLPLGKGMRVATSGFAQQIVRGHRPAYNLRSAIVGALYERP